METFIKADIFFFVTTVAVVLLTIFLIIVLWYAIFALKSIKELGDELKENINTASTEVKEIILHIKESFLFNLLFTKNKNRKKRSK